MTDKIPSNEQSETPVLNLIQGIKDGSMSPSILTKDQRQLCVETLIISEGFSVPQVAQLLERSEKTVRRDLIEIRQKNVLNPSPELAKQLIGNFLIKVEAHQTRLMRLARGNDGTIGERTQAEYSAWRVLKESMELLQTLGYLPLRPQQISGDIVHHVSVEENDKPLEDIDRTIQEIATIGQETNTLTPEIVQHITILQLRLEKAKLSQDAQKLLEHQQKLSQEKEISNE